MGENSLKVRFETQVKAKRDEKNENHQYSLMIYKDQIRWITPSQFFHIKVTAVNSNNMKGDEKQVNLNQDAIHPRSF